jgi:hypothetical protein
VVDGAPRIIGCDTGPLRTSEPSPSRGFSRPCGTDGRSLHQEQESLRWSSSRFPLTGSLLSWYKLEEPEEIVPDMGMSPNSGSQIAGVLDRRLERIVAAAKFRRFTMLHELGHYFLHPDLVYHRDIPLVGSERSEVRGRSRVEVVGGSVHGTV